MQRQDSKIYSAMSDMMRCDQHPSPPRHKGRPDQQPETRRAVSLSPTAVLARAQRLIRDLRLHPAASRRELESAKLAFEA